MTGRRGLWLMVVGLALLALAVGSLWRRPPPHSLTNVTVADEDAGAVDRAANSPTLAVDPANPLTLLLTERIDRPRFSCALYRSTDAGAHWNRVAVPIPPHYDTCYAPDITFDRRGNAVLVFLTLSTHPKDPLSAGNDPNGVWLMRSIDAGKTFGPPRQVLGPDNIQVRIAADPTSDRLYLLWLNGSDLENHTPLGLGPAPNPLKISVSGDGGNTFSAPVQVNASKHLRVGAASIVTGPGGGVNVLFEDFGNDLDDYNNSALPFNGKFSLVLARSVDYGHTFTESVVDNQIVRTSRFLIYLPPQPALALDPKGTSLFAAWQDGRGGAPDVLFRASHNDGKTWRATRRLNQRGAEAEAAFLPALSVSDNGRVDAVFLDERMIGSELSTNAMYAHSNDGGDTFSKPVAITRQPFDAFVGPLNPRTQAIDLGTRLALHSETDRAFAAWPDSHLGTPDTGRQDIAFANIDVKSGGSEMASAAPSKSPERAPALRSPQLAGPNPAEACGKGKRVRAIFLAYEAVPNELEGLRYFVADWGKTKKCFDGRVVTNSSELQKFDYDVVIVDISRDSAVPERFVTDISQAVQRGKPVAIFMQPADLATGLDSPSRVTPLRRIFPGLTMKRTCANSQFTKATGGPFDLFERSFHYESFVHGVYDVSVADPSTSWAVDLCKTSKPTVIRTPRGIVAGFYLAYEVSLADNNAPAITAKRLVVNVIQELARK